MGKVYAVINETFATFAKKLPLTKPSKLRMMIKKVSLSFWLLFALSMTVYTSNSLTYDAGVIINGVKWATRNVDVPGAFTAKPEDVGMFYQWNRNIGWSAADPLINSNGGTIWDAVLPAGSTWETSNNVCPSGWRVPTDAELISLKVSGYVWTNLNGVNGGLFGSGDNTVFLPAVGWRNTSNGVLNIAGFNGNYWSSTQSDNSIARNLSFDATGAWNNYWSTRTKGFSVRCVAE